MKQEKKLAKTFLIFALTLFISVLVISLCPLILLQTNQPRIIEISSENLTNKLVLQGQKLMEELASETIVQKASETAVLISLMYENGMPLDTTSRQFTEVAMQKIGATGYTCVYDCKTAVMLVHPNPALVGYDMKLLKDKLPSWWKIFSPSLACVDSRGFYDWEDADGVMRKKYMSMTPVKGTTLMVAATTYLEEFNLTQRLMGKYGEENLGETKTSMAQLTNKIIWLTLMVVLIFLALAVAGLSFFWKRFFTDIDELVVGIEHCSQGVYRPLKVGQRYGLAKIFTNYNVMISSLKQMQELKAWATFAQLATQVAHDIRSPLSALHVATTDLRELPEEQRILIRTAVQRITDITNDLSNQKRKAQNAQLEGAENLTNEKDEAETGQKLADNDSVQLLSAVIESLVSEKRMQFRNRSGINIEANLGKESYGLFAKIQPKAFKRLLSNLINNSVEAMEGGGSVVVTMRTVEPQSRRAIEGQNPSVTEKTDSGFTVVPPLHGFTAQDIQITISDTGQGIPADVLPRLFQRGETYGKKTGSGLGLYHARQTIEAFGGSITIQSETGQGTVVTIKLPQIVAPEWFLEKIVVHQNMTIVICDDDESIHHVWQNQLNNLLEPVKNVVHIRTPEALGEWFWGKRRNEGRKHEGRGDLGSAKCKVQSAKCKMASDMLFLCDYEFLGSEKTGLDVIEELGIGGQAILVTSHYEEDAIRTNCARLGVKLIPKSLAGFVPICVDRRSTIDAILIDDDPLIHSTWHSVARMKKKKIIAYKNTHDFLSECSRIDKTTPLYIDSKLSDGVKGEVAAKTIHAKGFENIYLATGTPASEFGPMPWIKGIVGKVPPFAK